MSKKEKLLNKFFRNPGTIKYPEIETLLLDSGFIKFEAKGSHKKFKHNMIKTDLIIPVHNNDCKQFYKKYVKKLLESLHNIE